MRFLDAATVLEDLDSGECARLLRAQSVGRVGLVVDERAFILPVSYAVVGDHVVFRTLRDSAFDRLVRDADVTFEIDHVDPGYHAGWSVVGFGRAEGYEEVLSLDELLRLQLRPWGVASDPGWVGIGFTELTGRRITQVPARLVDDD